MICRICFNNVVFIVCIQKYIYLENVQNIQELNFINDREINCKIQIILKAKSLYN